MLGEGRRVVRPDHGTILYWQCQCSCGNTCERERQRLKRHPSCGCKTNDRIREMNTKHGHTANRRTSKEFRAWSGMKTRCSNPQEKDSNTYASVTICKRWLSFENFLADMGPAPSRAHSLDRRDNTKGYDPENCRWATKKEQSLNRRNVVMVTIGSQTKCVADWCRTLNVSSKIVYNRMAAGQSPHEALSPINQKNPQRRIRSFGG